MTVGEITEQLDVGQSTVSHHLAKLAGIRCVLVERIGTQSHWRVNTACIDAFPSAAELIMSRTKPPDFDQLDVDQRGDADD